jgi:Spy/CpxP family protein refolding chaperone
MKNIFKRASLIASLTALLSLAAFAQTNAPQSDGANQGGGGGGRQGRMDREGRVRGERGGGRGMMRRRALARLNLSDAQRGQLREIEARYGRNFKTQRQEVRRIIESREQGERLTPEQRGRLQQLRGELRDSAEKMHAELVALLTPEQRDQLKRMREEGEARRKERRQAVGTPDDDQ